MNFAFIMAQATEYILQSTKTVLLLLIGGSKRTQERDIVKANKYWQEFQEKLL